MCLRSYNKNLENNIPFMLFFSEFILTFAHVKHQELPKVGTPTEFHIEITTVVKGCVSELLT